jgi:hypothetical protein
LDSITLSASNVPSQSSPTATVKLTAPAPAGNASIKIDSSNEAVVKVPANVSVAAGETSNAFTIETSTVRDPTDVQINATYAGVTKSTVLRVVPPGLSAQFSVSSASKGPDACSIINAAGAVDCVFDASSSSGFVAQYKWTLTVAGKEFTLGLPEGSARMTPATDCSFLSGGSVSSNGTFTMGAELRLTDRQGNSSGAVQKSVELTPNGFCGY